MDYLIAWGLVLLAGLGCLGGIFLLTRAIPSPWWRSLIRSLSAVWLLVPAQIGVVDGYYAPAFIVALFEGVFRREGDPDPALLILGVSTAVVLLVYIAVLILRRRRNS